MITLERREDIRHWKFGKLDLSCILYKEPASKPSELFKSEEQDHGLAGVLDWKLLKAAQPALDRRQKIYGLF